MFPLFVAPEYIPKMHSRLAQERKTIVLNTGSFWYGSPGTVNNTRKLWALSSSRVTPLNTCPGLRLRWCPLFWPPVRIENCCLPFYRERRLSSPRLVGIYPMTTIILFSELNTGPASSLMPGLGFPSPGLPSGFATELPAMLYSDGTLTHWVTIANFLAFLPPFPMLRAYLTQR